MRVMWLVVTVVLFAFAPAANALDLYVDNANGSDAFDGSAATVQTTLSGPVRTLLRASQLVQPGDTINLTKTGRPYFESLNLVGRRFSGSSTQPFVIRGNGAQLCGVRVIPNDAWRSLAPNHWQLNFSRKGWGRIFRDREAVPEFQPKSGETLLDVLPAGNWGQQRGFVQVHTEPGRVHTESEWTYAAVDIGVSLVDVEFVEISDLEVWGFRIDGVNADGHSREIQLTNVIVHDNGRAGVAAGCSAKMALEACQIRDNGRHSLLVTEAAGVRADDTTDFGGVEPTVNQR
ncbi:MAG TPA: right-handed parallel beta-helix repeat-containing protein [Planctomycetaceae bacterium]|nr:right-handed parallel beta-helix repeat-containing protein [Planctomycetaceae bacterium]